MAKGTLETADVQCANGMNAFVALPGAPASSLAVVLLHERYGLVQHPRDLARRFAEAGHPCIAPNLYFREPDQESLARGEGRAATNDPEVCADLDVAMSKITESLGWRPQRFGVIGVCATGRYPLIIAAQRSEVGACVVVYGGLDTRQWDVTGEQPEALDALIHRSQAPVLGVFGERDHLISVDHVRRFRASLEDAQRNYHVRIFPDAPHGWVNDTMPGRYRHDHAEAAFRLMLGFFERANSEGYPPDRIEAVFESDISRDYDFSKNVRLE
ncbi:MAG TPA: dienelactone hydrolase family protein [Chloroflexota bacterium]